ncbi:MAG: glycosyltransferase [bacterium]
MSWAGSERCLALILDLLPDADLVVGVMSPSLRDLNAVTRRARESWLAKLPTARRNYQWLLPVEALAFGSLDTRGYDLVISSSHALAKAVKPGVLGINFCYCYSPPRYIWDQHDVYMAGADWTRRTAMAAGRGLLQILDRWSARRVTHFVGISHHVAQRIARAYGRQARVVYPPVSAKTSNRVSTVGRREGFLLYLGRLVPYKRVDLIVRVATRLGIRTVIAGDGPERGRLEAIAPKNVQFLGAVSEVDAAELLDRCGVFVFCADEDFGIAPLEANAHGAPVVALRAGATVETMEDGKTAILFDDPSEAALEAAIRKALCHPWSDAALRSNAARFGPERFSREFASAVTEALDGGLW